MSKLGNFIDKVFITKHVLSQDVPKGVVLLKQLQNLFDSRHKNIKRYQQKISKLYEIRIIDKIFLTPKDKYQISTMGHGKDLNFEEQEKISALFLVVLDVSQLAKAMRRSKYSVCDYFTT